jgi:hypothetical protein
MIPYKDIIPNIGRALVSSECYLESIKSMAIERDEKKRQPETQCQIDFRNKSALNFYFNIPSFLSEQDSDKKTTLM